jgi:hypothetical protein
MKRFLIKVSSLSLLILTASLVQPLIGLYKIKQNYYYSVPEGPIRILKNKNSAQTLVIGCSNIEYNIDNNLFSNTDFLCFSGSQNLSFLQYLVESGYCNKYKNIILYLPFHFYKNKEASLPTNDKSTYYAFLSFEYIKNFIYHHPSAIFRNWNSEFDSILKYRNGLSNNPQFIKQSSTALLDEYYKKTQPDYFTCNHKFNSDFHQIKIWEIKTAFIVKLFEPHQTVNIIFPPIPNIPFNNGQVNKALKLIEKEDKSHFLNSPHTLDSSYFFNQWYHADYCGRALITKEVKKLLDSKGLD